MAKDTLTFWLGLSHKVINCTNGERGDPDYMHYLHDIKRIVHAARRTGKGVIFDEISCFDSWVLKEYVFVERDGHTKCSKKKMKKNKLMKKDGKKRGKTGMDEDEGTRTIAPKAADGLIMFMTDTSGQHSSSMEDVEKIVRSKGGRVLNFMMSRPCRKGIYDGVACSVGLQLQSSDMGEEGRVTYGGVSTEGRGGGAVNDVALRDRAVRDYGIGLLFEPDLGSKHSGDKMEADANARLWKPFQHIIRVITIAGQLLPHARRYIKPGQQYSTGYSDDGNHRGNGSGRGAKGNTGGNVGDGGLGDGSSGNTRSAAIDTERNMHVTVAAMAMSMGLVPVHVPLPFHALTRAVLQGRRDTVESVLDWKGDSSTNSRGTVCGIRWSHPPHSIGGHSVAGQALVRAGDLVLMLRNKELWDLVAPLMARCTYVLDVSRVLLLFV